MLLLPAAQCENLAAPFRNKPMWLAILIAFVELAQPFDTPVKANALIS